MNRTKKPKKSESVKRETNNLKRLMEEDLSEVCGGATKKPHIFAGFSSRRLFFGDPITIPAPSPYIFGDPIPSPDPPGDPSPIPSPI